MAVRDTAYFEINQPVLVHELVPAHISQYSSIELGAAESGLKTVTLRVAATKLIRALSEGPEDTAQTTTTLLCEFSTNLDFAGDMDLLIGAVEDIVASSLQHWRGEHVHDVSCQVPKVKVHSRVLYARLRIVQRPPEPAEGLLKSSLEITDFQPYSFTSRNALPFRVLPLPYLSTVQPQ